MAQTDWMTLLLLSSFLLFTVSRVLFPKRFDEFILLPFTNKYFLVQGKDDRLSHPFYLLLFGAQAVTVSLFALLFLSSLEGHVASLNWKSYLQIASVYVGFVWIKIYLEKIIGAAFHIEKLIDDYLFKKHSYRNLLALGLFTILLPLVYIRAPDRNMFLIVLFVIAILNIASLIYTYRVYIRLLIPNFFYFILYLCALEIAPYIILYKVVEKWELF